MNILLLHRLYSNSFLFDKMPRVLVYIVVVSMLTYIAHAQDISPAIEKQQINEKPHNNSSQIKVYEELCIH